MCVWSLDQKPWAFSLQDICAFQPTHAASHTGQRRIKVWLCESILFGRGNFQLLEPLLYRPPSPPISSFCSLIHLLCSEMNSSLPLEEVILISPQRRPPEDASPNKRRKITPSPESSLSRNLLVISPISSVRPQPLFAPSDLPPSFAADLFPGGEATIGK